MPVQNALEEFINASYEHDDIDDPFERDKSDIIHDNQSVGVRVMDFVRDYIDLPPMTIDLPACLQTPLFLGHGEADEKGSAKLDLQAALSLERMGMDVMWRGYEKFGRWYKVPEEIDSILG